MGGDEALNMVTERPNLIAAAYSADGVSDFGAHYRNKLISDEPDIAALARYEVGGTPSEVSQKYADRSAIDQLSNDLTFKRPILLDVDRADIVVENTQSYNFYNAVKAKSASAPIFERCWPGQPHSAQLNGVVGYSTAMDFFYNGGDWLTTDGGQHPNPGANNCP
jgi:hypothetical protein